MAWLPLWLLALAWFGALLGEQLELAWTLGMAPTGELGQAFFLGLSPLPLALLGLLALVVSWRAWRRERGPASVSPERVTGRLMGALFGGAVFLGFSYLVSLRIVLGLSSPVFVAAALALANLSLALVFLVLARGLGALIGRGLERLAGTGAAPLLAWVVPAWRFVLGLGVVALVALVWAVYKSHDIVEAVDWPRGLAMFLGAAVLPLGAWLSRRRAHASSALAGGALALGLGLMFAPGTSRALWLVGPPREVSWSAAVGLRLLRASFDFDHDGRLSFAGDGDCAAFDARRHPMAVDIPGDGVDQDCDGRDAVPGEVEFARFHSTLLPSSFERRPPLVLLLTVDAFNPRRLHSFRAQRDPMPTLGRFFASSVLFRSAFAQGPSTRLSFPATFTSRWDSEIPRRLEGRHPYPLEESVTTLAERFEVAGYRTAAVLPDALFRPPRWRGLLQGFARSELATPAAGSHHGARQVTDTALRELARGGERPLFLWVHYFDAHSPHHRPRGEPDYGDDLADRYDAELHHVDTQLGRLLAEVERRYEDRAWVVVTGDHSRAFDEPRHTRHGYGYDLYASVLQVPLAMRIPGVEAGEVAAPVSLLDVTPTLVDLLGLAPEEDHDLRGRSLVPALIRRPAGSPPHVYSQYFLEERLWTQEDPLVMASVFTDTRHLILDRRSGHRELYAWRSDPLERHDLMSSEEDAARELSDELAAFVRAVHSPPGAEEDDADGGEHGDEAVDAGAAPVDAGAPSSHDGGRSPSLARPAPRGPVPPAAIPGATRDAGAAR